MLEMHRYRIKNIKNILRLRIIFFTFYLKERKPIQVLLPYYYCIENEDKKKITLFFFVFFLRK